MRLTRFFGGASSSGLMISTIRFQVTSSRHRVSNVFATFQCSVFIDSPGRDDALLAR